MAHFALRRVWSRKDQMQPGVLALALAAAFLGGFVMLATLAIGPANCAGLSAVS